MGKAGFRVLDHAMLLANKIIVISVAADPKPKHPIRDADTQGAIGKPDADGPKTANLFEMQGGMARVVFQQCEALAGKLLNRLGESS